MKIHSYAFYNGHLSEVFKMRKSLERNLKQLEHIELVDTPSATAPTPASLSTGYLGVTELNQRRKSVQAQDDMDSIAKKIESGEGLDKHSLEIFERILKWEIDALNEDLRGKSSSKERSYPNNLTISNHYEFGVLPTLVYELEYPRSEGRDWYYIFEKSCGILGILIIMNLVSQAYIYPVIVRVIAMKEAMPLQARLKAFPWILNDLIFPFLSEYILVCKFTHSELIYVLIYCLEIEREYTSL